MLSPTHPEANETAHPYRRQDDAPYPAPIAAGEEERVSRRAKQPNTCGCGDLAARDSIGPLLRFAGYDPDEGEGRGDKSLWQFGQGAQCNKVLDRDGIPFTRSKIAQCD